MDNQDMDGPRPPALPNVRDEFQAMFRDAVEPLTNSIQHQMLRIEARLSGLESELQLLHQRLNSVDQRLEKFEAGIGQTQTRVVTLEAVLAELRSSRAEDRAGVEVLKERLASVTRTEPSEDG
jgi:chromosome segregation ATPase